MPNLLSKAKFWAPKLFNFFVSKKGGSCPELQAYVKTIDRYNASQPNSQLLDAIRQYNHSTIDSLNGIRPLSGLRILDVGASPHGYALEKCLALGVSEYIGIGLDITDDFSIQTKKGAGGLACMNAESLTIDDNEIDIIVTMSTFEHINDLDKTLSEFHRVLKPKGCALISFEPVWTCSYGHHLHHFGEISKLVPDWAHLIWSKEQMKEYLMSRWPDNSALSVADACSWIYEDKVLNRKSIKEIREILASCQMEIEWMTPLLDQNRNEEQLMAAAKKTKLSKDDLMIKGLSLLLYKR